MKLVNPSDRELDAVFAEKVAGMKPNDEGLFEHPLIIDGNHNRYIGKVREFTQSADAVLPWLMKYGMWDATQFLPLDMCRQGEAFQVRLGNNPGSKYIVGDADTFPRAAVIALLRAHGVEVEFTA